MSQPYYESEGITIYHADCRDVLPRIPSGVVITDPPYNIGYHYAGYRDSLSSDEYGSLLRLACRPPSVVIHYAEDLVALALLLQQPPEKVVAWVYNSNTRRQWRGIAWWGNKPDFTKDSQPYKNPNDKRIKERITAGKTARLYDWWYVDQVKNVGREKTAHPCQIPFDVMERVVKITDASLIIDPFLGSGTTLLAAKTQKRKAIGIEIDERYAEIAAKRLQAAIENLAAG